MKKSKFLQSSKDILSRSFNPAKCKTSLRLAGSRLKLLRNKKEVQVKQMKKEIAKLLESGQDQSARIRVEHVIREEKLMAAYDLLEIYCELIVARLPIIESQKNCPIDLKEAIASIIFASPRCGDVPELLDVRKQFTAKYGKDFTTAAIELRPQCGVGRMMVEKLSAVAPDGQTKVKILSAIAEEHNIKWDPGSYEDRNSLPSSDLLNGPSTIGKESNVYVEPPRSEPADVQAPPGNNKLHSYPSSSVGGGTLASAQTSGINMANQPETRPPGDGRSQLFHGDSSTSSMDGQRWNMEFKDAASAAQAAAESAERASMAARAAMSYATGSHQSDVNILKDAGPKSNLNSKFSHEQFPEESANIDPSEYTKLKKEQITPNDSKTAKKFADGHGSSGGYNLPASLKSKASIDKDPVDHGVPLVDQYSQINDIDNASRVEPEVEKQSFEHEAGTVNKWPEKSENLIEERNRKQHSVSSSRSHSSVSDDVNIFANPEDVKFVNDASEDPFVSSDKGGVHGEASQTSYHEYAAGVFDRFDSDTDDHGFDMGPTYDEPDPELHLPSSLSRQTHERISIHADSWPTRSNSNKVAESTSPFFTGKSSSPHFSENLAVGDEAELDNFAPVTFDESDGAASECDEEINTRHTGLEYSRDLMRKDHEGEQSVGSQVEDKRGQPVRSHFKDDGHPVFDKERLSFSSDEETHWERNKTQKYYADSPGRSSLAMPSALEPEGSNDIDYESSPKSEERLNFGKLTGGLRHKGTYNKLPFLKNHLDTSSSVKKETETTATTKFTNSPKKSTRTPDLHSDSDSDDLEEEYLQESSGHKQGMYTPSAEKEVKTKSSLGASKLVFGSDDSDLDEDPPKKPLSWKPHPRSGISQRTKASANSGATSHSKSHLRSDRLDSDAATISYSSESPNKFESRRKNSGKLGNYEQPMSEKVDPVPAKSNFWGPHKSEALDSDASPVKKPPSSTNARQETRNSEQPTPAKVTSKPTSSKFSGTTEKPSTGKANATTMQENKSSSVEEAKASISSESPKKESANTDDGTKRASHVHPKLPDYDTLFQSLQKNRS